MKHTVKHTVEVYVNGTPVDEVAWFDNAEKARDFAAGLVQQGKLDPGLNGITFEPPVPYKQGHMPSPVSEKEHDALAMVARGIIENRCVLMRGFFYGTECAFVCEVHGGPTGGECIYPMAVLLRPEDRGHSQDYSGRTPNVNPNYGQPLQGDDRSGPGLWG